MIEQVVGHLARHGVDEVVLSLGYRPDAFRRRLPRRACAGVRLHYAVEPEPLDTAGAIRFAAADAGIDERFLVVNGDVLTDLDVSALSPSTTPAAPRAPSALHPVDDPSAYGVVPTDDDGRVQAFVEKPPRRGADRPGSTPAPTCSSRRCSTASRRGQGVDRAGDVPGHGRRRHALRPADGCYWIDAGTPASTSRPSSTSSTGAAGRRGRRHRPRRPTSRADAGSSVRSWAPTPSWSRRRVEAVAVPRRACGGAVVDGSVVGRRRRSGRGRLGPGGSVVGDGEVVGAGSRVDGAGFPRRMPRPEA